MIVSYGLLATWETLCLPVISLVCHAVSVNPVDAEHLSILMGVFSLTNHHITNMCDMLRVHTYSLVASSEEVMGMIISNTNAYGIGAVHR